MNIDTALILVWISAAIFFTIVLLGAIFSISSAFLSCRKRTITDTTIHKVDTTSISLDVDKINPEI